MSEGPGSLALDPDFGDLDAIEAIEQVFGIELADAEVDKIHTVGDAYDMVLGKVQMQPGSCGTSMAFYRLRRALQPGGGPKLGVGTPLKPLLNGSARAFHDRLVRATGLTIPAMAATVIGLFSYGLFVGSFCAGAVALFKLNLVLGLWALGGIAVSYLLMRIDPQKLPADFETLGQLARATAAASFEKLSKGGATVSEASVWETLTFALAQHSNLPREQISRQTTFLPRT